jgi:hypothetical protein
MKSANRILVATLLLLPMLAGSAAFTQDTSTNQDVGTSHDRELNLRAYTELLRANVKAERVAIITQIMQFNDADAAKFWPIFRQYDLELTKLGDGRVQLIDDYINNYYNITNQKAYQLMTTAFTLEAKRAELKKKYFEIMSKALSARTAARFFQVENQMQHIIDLQISASLPTMQ